MFKPTPLSVASIAPGFSRINQHSRTIYSESLIRQGGFLLHFYREPLSQRSKNDLSALKELHQACQSPPSNLTNSGNNVEIIAMNPYDWEIQHRLAMQLQLPYSLLYDPISKTAKLYNAILLRTFFNHRLTYGVDAQGRIAFVHSGKVEVAGLLAQINQKIRL